MSSRTARVAGLCLSALVLSGCSSLEGLFSFDFLDDWFSSDSTTAEGGEAATPDMAELASRVPRISPGDRFTFDNPQVTWTAAEVTEERIRWVADDGDEQITGRNPLLPALAWNSKGQGKGRRLITDMSEPFFPLRVGKVVTFESTVSTDRPPYAWEFTWRCETLGTETVETPAGTFPTYRIVCGRKRPDELTFNYAPQVGHYVRMVSAPQAGGKKTVTREMTDFSSRHYIAYVDPMTTALDDDSALGAARPARPGDAMSDDGMAMTAEPPTIEEVPMTAEPPADKATASNGTAEDEMADGKGESEPVLVMGEGGEPRSGLSAEGDEMRAGAGQSARKAAEPPPTPPTKSAQAAEEAVAGARIAAEMAPNLPDGAIGLHLASYKNAANVERGWKQLNGANGDLLGGTRPIVRRVDVPGKGIFFRLHAGPVASMEDARALCKALKARDVYCAAKTL